MGHILAGLVALVLGVFGIIYWWPEFGQVMRGLIPFLLVVAGLIALGSRLSKTSDDDKGSSEDQT